MTTGYFFANHSIARSLQPTTPVRRLPITMRRFAVPILLALLLGTIVFGLAELAGLNKQQTALARLEKDRAALEMRIRELEKLNRELAARLNPASTAPDPAVAAGEGTRADPALAFGPGDMSGRFRARFDGARFTAMMGDPEVRRLLSVQQKGALDSRYAPLFKALNLNPADLEKFKNLLVEKQGAIADVVSAARKEGLDPRTNRDAIRQLVQSTQAEIDTGIRATLGDAAFAQYSSFESTQPERNVVSQLAQRLSYSTTPLSDTQSEQLVGVLSAAGGTNSGNGGVPGGPGLFRAGGLGSGGPASKITDTVVTQAQGVLSTQQLAALQSLQQEQEAAAQLARQMREARQNGAATPVGGGVPGAQPVPSPGGG